MAYTVEHEITGLTETVAMLTAIGVPDDVTAEAINISGQVIVDEAQTLAPVKTGAMRAGIKVVPSTTELKVTSSTPQGYMFHAVEMGKSKGGFTYSVPASAARRAYTRQSAIPNYPFMFIAAKAKEQEIVDAWVTSFDKVVRSHPPGSGAIV